MTSEGYEYFDAAADIGIRAWGVDLPSCLRQCALGVFDLIVPVRSVRATESREVSARGAPVEALLANWLDECLYVHELEGFAVCEVSRPEVTGARVHGILHGEPLDPARHPRGTIVKAARSHGVVEADGVVTACVLLNR